MFLALENNHVIQRGKILLEELVNFYSPLLGYLKQNSSMSQSIREIRDIYVLSVKSRMHLPRVSSMNALCPKSAYSPTKVVKIQEPSSNYSSSESDNWLPPFDCFRLSSKAQPSNLRSVWKTPLTKPDTVIPIFLAENHKQQANKG